MRGLVVYFDLSPESDTKDSAASSPVMPCALVSVRLALS